MSRMHLNYDGLFWLTSGGKRGELELQSQVDLDERRLMFGGVIPGPLPLRRYAGRRVYDFVNAGPLAHLVSPRVVEVLEGIGATGWTTTPITGYVEGLDGYAMLVVTGRCGDQDVGRAERTLTAGDEGRTPMPVFRGFYFESDEWDGSDVFSTSPAGFLMVTDRVVDALKAAKITNFEVEPLTAFELPDYERARLMDDD